MKPINATRRSFILGGLATLTATVAPWPRAAQAATAAQAEALVDKLVADINRVISSGKSEASMIRDFEGIFKRYADLPTIAATALGVDGRRATSAQKKAFTDAFTGYISRKYGKRFREFIGGKIEVNSSKSVKNAYQVTGTMILRNQAPFEVVFFVGQNSGKFYNLYLEGVNMLLTERTEIGAMLDKRRGDIDAMIADLRKAG
ncbi:MlaC/ttg2D family ABC transporter substrate-binding protein [Tropicibacter oceani]|uniref:ABC transporter substrate-binding protein n=1 Tax=Tropicibacter oceani TaxID=3058420 RepID=A0ABY8QJX1_9RHOB|nr:ABC transporter substrate-binding protein [Tropicibacter oceani]WGW04919.1 ABC transporter substrate-binding protein [Tropicibacter oceani]